MTAPKPFSIMTKPIGPRCNIDCTYCYYLEKEKLFPKEKKFKMSPEVLETYIRQLIETSVTGGMREVPFAWQGGEPTMLGVDFFRRVVALQKKHLPQGVTAANAFQTNGILLDDDWGAFFKENGFLVGISIDGPDKVHNRYRIDRQGRSTFDKVMAGLEVLQKHGVDYNALTTVHRANGGKGKEVYKFLKSRGIEFMQFIPIAERNAAARDGLAGAPQVDMDPGNKVSDWSVSPKAYGKFLCDAFDLWFKQDIGTIFVQHFDTMLALWMGQPSPLCVFAETCGNALALEHEGNLYSCDHYVYDDYLLGNITETPMRDMVWSDRQMQFGLDKKAALTQQCQQCSFRFACNGGCPKHRFALSKSGEAGHDYFCESHTMFFKQCGERLGQMAQLVRMGRPAWHASPQMRRNPPAGQSFP